MSPARLVRRRSGLYVPRSGVPAPTDAYGAAVFADSPAAWWRFAEAAADNVNGGIWLDHSGNGRTLVNSSSPLGKTTSLLSAPPSGDGAATVFSGGRWALAANAAWMNTGTFTVEMLVTPNGSNEMFVTRFNGADATSSWFVWRAGFNLTFAVDSGGTRTSVTSSTSIFNGVTYHVVATLNGGTAMQLFLNAASVGTGTSGAMNSTAVGMSVGADTAGGNGSALVIDEVAFYPTVLSGARITAHNAAK